MLGGAAAACVFATAAWELVVRFIGRQDLGVPFLILRASSFGSNRVKWRTMHDEVWAPEIWHLLADGSQNVAIRYLKATSYAASLAAGGAKRTVDNGFDVSPRRLFDTVTAALTLLVMGPAMIVLAVLVRTSSRGPVFYRAFRTGKNGESFALLKFRTMRLPRYECEPDDERVTRIGRILRTTSMDELPQLINVLRGEMAVIGPRPTIPEQVAYYNERQRERLAVRPGLTGWAQVAGRNVMSWPARLERDIWYVRNRSFRVDLRILLRTVLILIRSPHPGVENGVRINTRFPATTASQRTYGEIISGGQFRITCWTALEDSAENLDHPIVFNSISKLTDAEQLRPAIIRARGSGRPLVVVAPGIELTSIESEKSDDFTCIGISTESLTAHELARFTAVLNDLVDRSHAPAFGQLGSACWMGITNNHVSILPRQIECYLN